MRPKEKWGKTAILADVLARLGLLLAKNSMWEKYLFVRETTGEGCELAEKAANLLFSDPEVIKLIKELDDFYVRFERLTKN